MLRKLFSICFVIIGHVVMAQSQSLAIGDIFTDSMVLQRNIKVPMWGLAGPNKTVTINYHSQLISTVADQNGKWMVRLPKSDAREAFNIKIQSDNEEITLKNVLMGDVWLASGQSNMQFTLSQLNNPKKEIDQANYPLIRFINVKKNISEKPLSKMEGNWVSVNPFTAKELSAVAYFFARDLHLEQKVPVGIISSSWGGTPAEAWTSGDMLATHPDFKDSVANYQKLPNSWEKIYQNYLHDISEKKKVKLPDQKNYPTALYNAMIAPLLPFGLKGVIWYQGEGNAPRAKQYETLFPSLIKDWRNKFESPELPFIFVQLTGFKDKKPNPTFKDDWVQLREAQSKTLSLPYTGMAVTTDIGDAKDIHPKNKLDVGKRLYAAARNVAYQLPGEYTGPSFKSMKIKGQQVLVKLSHANGLNSKTEKIEGFAIAGADKNFYWADNAKIVGKKIILSSTNVASPIAIRYNWESNPNGKLYNNSNLPAVPFRTDDW